MNKPSLFLTLLLLCILISCKKHIPPADYSSWRTYAGSKDGNRYSSNTQITLKNVAQLKVAWIYSSHDRDTGNRSQNQCNPIVIGGILYATSPKLKLFALDAATGAQKWIFDPSTEGSAKNDDPFAYYKICRGVVYWEDEAGKNKRVFYSVGAKTYAIDPANGQPIRSFGKGGFLDLSDDLGRKTGSFISGTTPGVVYKDLLIMGARVSESEDAAPGHIRAYDALTGKLRWIFHTIPHPGEKGFDTWPDTSAWRRLGAANNWSGMALDEERGIVYVPTGSVGGDFYGANRKGPDLYANCLLALDAETGKYIWHYQVVHHDLWDRDLPANPNLVTIQHNGKTIDAVAQITKHGFIFMFDRTNGEPVFPIVEKPVPTANALPGEHPWPTQPIPSLPQPFARQHLGPEDITDLSPDVHKTMMEQYNKVKYNAMFSPPSKDGVWIFPGFDGGGEWGGAAVDPETKIMYISNSELPWAQVMIDVPKNNYGNSLAGRGHVIYNNYCISCHGPELKGNGTAYPSLQNINKKYNELQVGQIVTNGRNMMPAFKQLRADEKKALLAFVLKLPGKPSDPLISKEPVTVDKSQKNKVPYTMNGYNRFLDKNGYPGIKPPWGTLDAVNLTTGKLLWKVPLGEYPELTKRGIPVTGTELYGGPLVTKGGLVFVAATKDQKIRAFDKHTGKQVWEASLPAAGYATPAAYSVAGKQYIVIACGGGKIGSKSGDSYVCFALPGK